MFFLFSFHSDKAIAMAAAYETWQKWNQERMGADTMPQVDKIRSMLQSTAENEVCIGGIRAWGYNIRAHA